MVAYGRGDKGKATKLHSTLIRSIKECERCGYQCPCNRDDLTHGRDCKLETAHIITRSRSATRTLLNNAYCLCSSCHRFFTDWAREFSRYITDTFAQDLYEDMKRMANTPTKVDWSLELERLKNIEIKDRNSLILERSKEWEEVEKGTRWDIH